MPNEILLHMFSLSANMADDDLLSCEPHYTYTSPAALHKCNLPSLRHMDITSYDSKHCAFLLENIASRQGCSLFLCVHFSHKRCLYISTFGQLITQYSNNHFNFCGIIPRSFAFRLSDASFNLPHTDSWSFIWISPPFN